MEGAEYFDHMWENILGMSPFVSEMLKTKAVQGAQTSPIIACKAEYLYKKELTALLLPYPLKLKMIDLP